MFHIITDTHFGQASYESIRIRPNDFEEKIIYYWKKLVAPTDTVIHLGDLGFENNSAGFREIMALPGKKILLRGNHDKQSQEYYMSKGIDFCCDELVLSIAGIKILFTHRPRYDHSYDINIHGHQHNIYYPAVKKLFLPIALEVMGYMPIPVDEKFLKKLTRLIERYWLNGKLPTPIEIKSFGLEPISVLREEDIYGELGKNKYERLRINRTFFEMYSQIEGFDNYVLRTACLKTKKDFIHDKISLRQFINDMEHIKHFYSRGKS